MDARSLRLAAAVVAVGTTIGCTAQTDAPPAVTGGAPSTVTGGAGVRSSGEDTAASVETHPGAALFASRCAACHRRKADDLAARFRTAQDPDRLEETLRTFLESHGRADDAEDAQILAYVRQKAV